MHESEVLFSTPDHLRGHVRALHKDIWSSLDDTSIAALAEGSIVNVLRKPNVCPLCCLTPKDMESLDYSSEGNTPVPRAMENHIAEHLQNLMVLSLQLMETQNEEPDGDSKGGSMPPDESRLGSPVNHCEADSDSDELPSPPFGSPTVRPEPAALNDSELPETDPQDWSIVMEETRRQHPELDGDADSILDQLRTQQVTSPEAELNTGRGSQYTSGETHEANVTVGWIAPTALELTPAIAILENPEEVPKDNTLYHVGRVGRHRVVMVVCPRIGTHPAAAVLADMRRSFPNISHVLVVGIAGGMPYYGPDMQQIVLGDVVVSCPRGNEGGVVHYEFSAWEGINELNPSGHMLHPSDLLLTAVNNLRAKHMTKPGTIIPQLLRSLRESLTEEERPEFNDPGSEQDYLFPDDYPHRDRNKLCDGLCDLTISKRRGDRGDKAIRKEDSPRIHYGTIGSANTLIISSEKRNELYEKHQVICFEMESAGVMGDYQALVIRGICDYANSHRNKKWQKYAAATAAAYAKEALLYVPPAKLDERGKNLHVEMG
ncbi:hypothetical protein DL765_009366 [Monosporascus sp. GIB2]|nr:hypothetical protein DL765_009366 [Monosporascus sp. GIB2]